MKRRLCPLSFLSVNGLEAWGLSSGMDWEEEEVELESLFFPFFVWFVVVVGGGDVKLFVVKLRGVRLWYPPSEK